MYISGTYSAEQKGRHKPSVSPSIIDRLMEEPWTAAILNNSHWAAARFIVMSSGREGGRKRGVNNIGRGERQ